MKRCIICGENTAEHYQKEVNWYIKGTDVKLKLWGTWCTTCDDGVISAADRELNKKEYLQNGIQC